jgi:hypothetical protein
MSLSLSLSRLDHWWRGRETHPDVMQGTAECHHQSADTLLPQAESVFDNATTLHTPVDMRDPSPAIVQGLVGPLLLPCALLAASLLGRHADRALGEHEGQEAQILQQPTPGRQGRGCRIGNPFIMDAASTSVTEQEDDEQGIDEQDMFDGMVLLLAALTPRLFHRVLRADNAPFGPVMGTRGDTDAAAGTATTGASSSSRGTITVAASVSATPSRCASAIRERVGASPRVCSAASSAGKSTLIH